MKPMIQQFVAARGVTAVAVVIGLTNLASAQRPDPDSPRYKGAMAIGQLIHSTGDEPLQTFMDDWVASELRSQHTDESILSMIRQIRADFGKAPMRGVAPMGSYSAQLMFGSQGPGSRTSLDFKLESKPPHRFIDLGYEAPQKTDASDAPVGLAKQLRTYMDDLVSKGKFSGTVLVAKDGEPIFKEAYGLASKRYNVQNRIDTKINIGSMNKMFTGVAVCQLVEQGRLAFDDKIIKHLPDYPNREVADKVTIHQLLTHTSGLGSYFNDKYAATWTTIKTLDQLLPTFVEDPLAFEPGAQFGYSNCGAVVLGLIIERISGQSYFDYVREHIYKPAGMTNTDSYAMDEPVPNLAIGYTNLDADGQTVDGPRHNNLFLTFIMGSPAGGGFSTVEDMLKFSLALQEYKLLGAEMTETMLAGKASMGPGMKYAYLFGDISRNGHRSGGHNGGGPGISSDFRFYAQLGYTYVVLANYDRAASGVGRFIGGIIESAPAPESKATSIAVQGQPSKTSGQYRMGVMLRPDPNGVRVDSFVPGGPGEKSKLLAGDVIYAINDRLLGVDPRSVIREVISSSKTVTLSVRRGEKRFKVELTPERADSPG